MADGFSPDFLDAVDEDVADDTDGDVAGEQEDLENEDTEDGGEGSEDDEDVDEDEDEDADETEEEEEEEPKVSETAELLAQMQLLKQEIAALKKGPAKEEEDTEPYAPFQSKEFTELTETMAWDEDETKAFQKFFGTMMEKNNEAMVAKAQDSAVSTVAQRQAAMAVQQRKAQQFYEDNAELASVKPFVKTIATTVSAELGTEDLDAVLKETAARAYKALGLKKKKGKKPASAKDRPAFGKRSGARSKTAGKKGKKKNKLQTEIDEILDI